MILPTLSKNLRVIIIGASGGIGNAFLDALNESSQVSKIYALSRQNKAYPSAKIANLSFDLTSEESLKAVSESLRKLDPFDLIIVATGLLQGDGVAPEKSIRDLTYKGLEKSFLVNTIGPAMTARYFLPLLRRDKKSVFTALSARVGSISDNRIGGWYGYRASKAALNMILKTLSIEFGRRHKQAVILGLHPGTVDTTLSEPFQGNVPDGKLFTPEYSVEKLLAVIDKVDANDSGKLIDWAGKEIAF